MDWHNYLICQDTSLANILAHKAKRIIKFLGKVLAYNIVEQGGMIGPVLFIKNNNKFSNKLMRV